MTDGTDGPRGARESGAPHTGGHTTYELCNVFGTPTGRRVMVVEGEPLPATPKGWSWQPVAE